MCDSLEEFDGRITADYQVEPKCIIGILPEERRKCFSGEDV